MRFVAIFFIAFFCFIFPSVSNSLEMSSANYKILTELVSVGGASSTSVTYQLSDTVGEAGGVHQTTSTSSNYQLAAGFWPAATAQNLISATLSSNSINLGALSTASVSQASQTLTVSTDMTAGYTTYISEDHDLSSSGSTIPSIGGGAVTAGTAGYGIITSGTAGQMNAGATALTTGLQALASSASAVANQATTITYKASVGGSTVSGNYSHTLTFTTVVNY